MSSTTLKVTANKKKTTTTKTAEPVVAPITTIEVPAVVKKVTTTAKKGKTITAPEPEPIIPVTPIPVAPIEEELIDEVPVIENVIKTEIKRRRVVTKDQFLGNFDEVSELIANEISNNKDDKNVNGKYLKFLRNINKNMITMKKDAQKLIKTKRKSLDSASDDATVKDANKVSSGFLKPVPISHAMASFTGWSPTELKSRVDVTKFLCSYIKDNNLQNPTDRRQIILDSKLMKLLDYKEGAPLTYFDMQSHLKKHFPKATAIKV
jgi:chromatin remodeling complex protein RSC6